MVWIAAKWDNERDHIMRLPYDSKAYHKELSPACIIIRYTCHSPLADCFQAQKKAHRGLRWTLCGKNHS